MHAGVIIAQSILSSSKASHSLLQPVLYLTVSDIPQWIWQIHFARKMDKIKNETVVFCIFIKRIKLTVGMSISNHDFQPTQRMQLRCDSTECTQKREQLAQQFQQVNLMLALLAYRKQNPILFLYFGSCNACKHVVFHIHFCILSLHLMSIFMQGYTCIKCRALEKTEHSRDRESTCVLFLAYFLAKFGGRGI